MKTIFLTGGSGFIGTVIRQHIKKHYPEYFIYSYSGRLNNSEQLKEEFSLHSWDFIFHFAGISSPRYCDQHPAEAENVNFKGTQDLAILAAENGFKGLFVFLSTGLIYDQINIDGKVAISDETIDRPTSVYAKTKSRAEAKLQELVYGVKFKVLVLRLFNHVHKTQSNKFFLSSVYSQLKNTRDGGHVTVGNLDLYRDFSPIQMFVETFDRIALKNDDLKQFQVIGLSSGRSRHLRHLIEVLTRRLSKTVHIIEDEKLKNESEPKEIVAHFVHSYKRSLSDEEFIDYFLKDLF